MKERRKIVKTLFHVNSNSFHRWKFCSWRKTQRIGKIVKTSFDANQNLFHRSYQIAKHNKISLSALDLIALNNYSFKRDSGTEFDTITTWPCHRLRRELGVFNI